MQTQHDLQQNAGNHENQERTKPTPDCNAATRIPSSARKKNAKTNQAENGAQVIPRYSPAQLEAYRQNAKKSTGPRTKRGKSISSQNARKYSSTARFLLVRGMDSSEDPAEFAAMLADLEKEYEPATPIERSLVENVAACLWRRRRAMRFETAALQRQHDRACIAREAAIKKIEALEVQKQQCESQLKEANTDRTWMQEAPAMEDTLGRAEREAAIRRVIDECDLDPLDPKVTGNILMALVHKAATGELELLKINHSLKAAIKDRDHADREIHAMLPPYDELGQLVRYENMIDRQFHRSLCALRRIRSDWGQQMERKCHVLPTPSADNAKQPR